MTNSLKPTSIYDLKLKSLVKMCLFALNTLCVSCSETFQANMWFLTWFLGLFRCFWGEMFCSAEPVMGSLFGTSLVVSLCWLVSRMGIKMPVKCCFRVGNAEPQGCSPLPYPHITYSYLGVLGGYRKLLKKEKRWSQSWVKRENSLFCIHGLHEALSALLWVPKQGWAQLGLGDLEGLFQPWWSWGCSCSALQPPSPGPAWELGSLCHSQLQKLCPWGNPVE